MDTFEQEIPLDIEEKIENYNNIMYEISKLILTPVNKDWGIIDFDKENNLYLIHYNKNANMKKYGHIRGVVCYINLEIEEYRIICRSFNYTPIITFPKFIDKTKYILKDNIGNDVIINMDTCIFKMGHEGVTIRVFYHNGKVWYSSYRKLNIFNTESRWGNSKLFKVMYKELNAPDGESLFDMNKKYSPYIHIFILSHKELLNVSKEDFKGNNGYVIYIGTRKIWDPKENDKYSLLDVDNISHPPNNITDDLSVIKSRWDKECNYIYTPPDLNISQVNHILTYGWYNEDINCYHKKDKRVGTGESVIVYPNGMKSNYIIKIQSPAYTWRLNLRGMSNNLLHRYYQLMDYKKTNFINQDMNKTFFNIFPTMNIKHAEQIINNSKNGITTHFWPHLKRIYPKTQEDIYKLITASFIMMVPLEEQQKIAEMYYKYISSLTTITDFLFKLYIKFAKNEISAEYIKIHINENVFNLLNKAKSQIFCHNLTELPSTDGDIRSVIQVLVNNEYSGNLYKIIKYIDKNSSKTDFILL